MLDFCKKNKWVLSLIFISLFYTVMLWFKTAVDFNNPPPVGSWYFSGDAMHYYSRLIEIRNCFLDGNMPWFYYYSYDLVGYGVSFFYGALTVIPFIPLTLLSIKGCLATSMFAILLFNAYSIHVLAKRFTENSLYASFLFICCPVFIMQVTLLMYGSLYAQCFGFLFLAYCVDFFRDKKSFIPASVLFFLIMHTNKPTSIVVFVGCILLFIYYFDKKQFIDYIKFGITTGVLCSYVIANVLYHKDILTSTNLILSYFYPVVECTNQACTYAAMFGTKIFYSIFFAEPLGTTIVSFSMFIAILCLLFKHHTLSKRLKVLVVLAFVGIILSIGDVFENIVLNIPIGIQFSLRYTLFIGLFFCILLARYKLFKKMLIITSIFVCITTIPYTTLGWYGAWNAGSIIGAGDYLDITWDWTYQADYGLLNTCYLLDEDRTVIDTVDRNLDESLLYTDSIEDFTGTILFPKLYYNGYKCWDSEGNYYDVAMGWSQYIEVELENFDGIIYLEYQHPIWLQLLFWSTTLGACILYIKEIYYDKRKIKE